MYASSRAAGYGGFAVRRTIRIYGPYLGALAIAITADYLLSRGYRSHFNPWFNRTWTLPVRWSDIWAHVAFLGVYNNATFDASFWSLVHEMRISLIFPFLYLLAAGKAVSRQISVALLLLVAGTVATATFARNTDLGQSVHFAGLFILGIFVSERKTRLAEWYRSLAQRQRIIFAILSAILFYYGRLISHAFPTPFAGFLDIPVGAGATGLLVLAFSSAAIRAVSY